MIKYTLDRLLISGPIGSGWVGFEEYIRLNPAKMEMTRS